MKTKFNSSLRNICLLAAIVTSAFACAANAATIVSSNFSFGYGANLNSATNTWSVQSPSSNTTIGDFTFSPSLSGGFFSSAGTTFFNRVLTDTGGGNNYTGHATQFSATINASWAGDPESIEPGLTIDDLRFCLVITEIRIYGVHMSSGATTTTLAFNETTPGLQSSSTPITLQKFPLDNKASGILRIADNYTNVSWTSLGDYSVDGQSSGSRSFTLSVGDGSPASVAVDGFEVFGYIEVSQIPEPGTVFFLIAGAGFLLVRTARRRNS